MVMDKYHQKNNNCNVFNGPVYGGVFLAPQQTDHVAEAEVTDAVEIKETTANVETPRRGRKAEFLFEKDGEKDDAFTEKCAKVFIDFLSQHHCKDNKTLCSSKGNFPSKVFVALYELLTDKGILSSNSNGNACYDFLCSDCQLACDVTKKSYSTFIKKLIDKGNTDIQLMADVKKMTDKLDIK
jgi:hypothetical protein